LMIRTTQDRETEMLARHGIGSMRTNAGNRWKRKVSGITEPSP
jgi:hypothetical protein